MKPIDDLTDDEFTGLVQQAARLPDAPPAMLRAAVDLWRQSHPTTLDRLAEAAGQVIHAVLSFDSWARPATALGMRSAGSDTRHLLFSASGRDVDLRISRVGGGFAMAGQILGPDEAGTIELAATSGHADSQVESSTGQSEPGTTMIGTRTTDLDELGEFRLTDIPAGTYLLTVHLGKDEIALPPIVVGERTA